MGMGTLGSGKGGALLVDRLALFSETSSLTEDKVLAGSTDFTSLKELDELEEVIGSEMLAVTCEIFAATSA